MEDIAAPVPVHDQTGLGRSLQRKGPALHDQPEGHARAGKKTLACLEGEALRLQLHEDGVLRDRPRAHKPCASSQRRIASKISFCTSPAVRPERFGTPKEWSPSSTR